MAAATADIQGCIEACHATVEAASRVLARHLGDQRMRDCLKMCLDATDLCGTTVKLLQRGSPHAPRVCEVLYDLCMTCASACEAWPSDECQRCAEACRVCAEAAKAVASA